ncbi:hypothetical protein ACN27J_14845 [Solwaraspora sp. WMMB762]|uniref:hypothetical protein n=1 Tax=Solwaraspora sp. WMMB762 TaxID=3404120 RepID=UPI003B931FB5
MSEKSGEFPVDNEFGGSSEDEDDDDFAADYNPPLDMLVETSGAIFDALTLVGLLESVEKPSEFEIHTFAYLSCLLNVYDGHPASSWGYSFSAVPPAVPFSSTISLTLETLLSMGLLTRSYDTAPPSTDSPTEATVGSHSPIRLELTDAGKKEQKFLSSLETMRRREKYLEAAKSTSLIYSVPAVVNSLVHEPQLWQAAKTVGPRKLLVAISSRPLYDQFEALKDALGRDAHHLSVPATVYVGYLEESARGDLNPSDRTEEAEKHP